MQINYGAEDPIAVPADYRVPLTAFSISPLSSKLILNPAGTLATGTVLLPADPLNGQEQSIISTQTQTALTVTPAAGDSIIGAPTALVANTPVTLRYVESISAWVRSP